MDAITGLLDLISIYGYNCNIISNLTSELGIESQRFEIRTYVFTFVFFLGRKAVLVYGLIS